MKRLFGITMAAVMVAAFLFGGSTLMADASDTKSGADRVVIAGTDRIINTEEETIAVEEAENDGPTDITAFLVGEFNVEDGSVARFNGHGEVTLIGTDGFSRSGSYDMEEYEAQQAIVTIEMDSGTSRYSFNLTSGSGDFTLTDKNGTTISFVPVQY